MITAEAPVRSTIRKCDKTFNVKNKTVSTFKVDMASDTRLKFLQTFCYFVVVEIINGRYMKHIGKVHNSSQTFINRKFKYLTRWFVLYKYVKHQSQ